MFTSSMFYMDEISKDGVFFARAYPISEIADNPEAVSGIYKDGDISRAEHIYKDVHLQQIYGAYYEIKVSERKAVIESVTENADAAVGVGSFNISPAIAYWGGTTRLENGSNEKTDSRQGREFLEKEARIASGSDGKLYDNDGVTLSHTGGIVSIR